MSSQYQTGFYVKQGGNDVVMTDDVTLTIDGQEIPMDASISVGAEATNAIVVSIQLQSKDGTDLANRAFVHAYLSSDANGDTIPTAPTGTVAIGTDGTIIAELRTKLAWLLLSEADGDIDISITDTGTPTFYLHVLLPNGKRVTSGAITFA